MFIACGLLTRENLHSATRIGGKVCFILDSGKLFKPLGVNIGILFEVSTKMTSQSD